jgi:poly-gamma-glutamate synthesis protein (capsule biosynthesis protein)
MARHRSRSSTPRRLPAALAGTAVAAAVLGGGAAALALPGRSDDVAGATADAQAPAATATTNTPEPSPSPPEPAVFTILGAGDVLLHNAVTSAATQDGVIDYSTVLSGLDPWVQGADLALCHFETPIVPPGEKVTTYPMFGVPAQIVTDLVEQGWDGCSTASNHSIDRGFAGVEATLTAFDAAGLGHVGTARSQAESDAPQLYTLERAGRTLTVAQFSIAYGLNGLVLPADKPWAVDLIDVDRTIARATAARAAGADLVVVSLHDGTEYRETPTESQLTATQALADSGVVDLVLGHHAHVPQAITHLAGGPDGAGMWVAYGLGNMVSNQSAECCTAATSNGLLLTATVTAEPDGPAHVTGVEWTGITVDRAAGHRVRALVDAVADPDAGTLSADELAAREQRVREVVGTEAPERTTPPTPTGPAPVVQQRP